MGLRKKISDLFKDPEELAKEERRKKEREKRRKSLEIQNRIDAMEGDILELKGKSKELWNQAKDMMRQGQKQRAAEIVRAHDELEERITMKSRKAIYFKMVVEKLNDSASDAAIISGIKNYAESLDMDISAADVQMDLGDIQIATAGIDDIDKAIDKAINRDVNKQKIKPTTEIKASEESMRLLENELAGEMNAELTEGTASDMSSTSENSVMAEADAGLEELKALMGTVPKS